MIRTGYGAILRLGSAILRGSGVKDPTIPAVVICTRYGVSVIQAYRWLGRFLEGGRGALTDKRGRRDRDPLLDENRQLKELVGQQTLIIRAKKLVGTPGR